MCLVLQSMDHFDDIGPSVVMASPGMMQSGLSRELFESWCTDKRNGCHHSGLLCGRNARQGEAPWSSARMSHTDQHQISYECWIKPVLTRFLCSISCLSRRRSPPCQDRSFRWRCPWTISPSLLIQTTSRPASSSELWNLLMW